MNNPKFMNMNSEKQYIDLYRECREMICSHSAAPLNAVRDDAFAAFSSLGFPTRKVERYKYTDIGELFAPTTVSTSVASTYP